LPDGTEVTEMAGKEKHGKSWWNVDGRWGQHLQAIHCTLCETYPVVFIGLVLEKYVRVANTIFIIPVVNKYTC
jgi:hypothetical protein